MRSMALLFVLTGAMIPLATSCDDDSGAGECDEASKPTNCLGEPIVCTDGVWMCGTCEYSSDLEGMDCVDKCTQQMSAPSCVNGNWICPATGTGGCGGGGAG